MIRMVTIMHDDFECSALDEGEQSGRFKITTGVKQGCVMFLLTVDWTMRRTTERHEMASDGTSQVCLKTSTL